jgi:hypothetical protein
MTKDKGDPKNAAQVALLKCPVLRDQIYRHYKGGMYVVIIVALMEETMEPVVVYRSNKRGTSWVRTLANFLEKVKTNVGTPDEREVPRFTLVED